MLKVVQDLLDQLAERCLAVTGGMLSSTLQSLHIAHVAEEQRQLEELARGFEADELPDIAASIRDRAKHLSINGAVPQTKILLQLAASSPALNEDPGKSESSSPGIEAFSTRRIRSRTKRTTATAVTPADPQADASDAFFPLNTDKSQSPAEGSPA